MTEVTYDQAVAGVGELRVGTPYGTGTVTQVSSGRMSNSRTDGEPETRIWVTVAIRGDYFELPLWDIRHLDRMDDPFTYHMTVHVDGQPTLATLHRCARCGSSHTNQIEWHKLIKPMVDNNGTERWTHWASCPTTGEPILMRHETISVYEPTQL